MKNIIDITYQVLLRIAYRVLLFFWFLFRPQSYGVGVAVWYSGKVLIIQNSYRDGYSFPGGYRKFSENERLTAIRELNEEVGLRLNPEDLNHDGQFLSTHEFKKDHVSLFSIELRNQPAIRIDNREVVGAAFLTPGEAIVMNLHPIARSYLESKGFIPETTRSEEALVQVKCLKNDKSWRE